MSIVLVFSWNGSREVGACDKVLGGGLYVGRAEEGIVAFLLGARLKTMVCLCLRVLPGNEYWPSLS